MGRVGEGGGLRLERKREETISTNTKNKPGTFCSRYMNIHMLLNTMLFPCTLKHDSPKHPQQGRKQWVSHTPNHALALSCIKQLLSLVHNLGVLQTQLHSCAMDTIKGGSIVLFSQGSVRAWTVTEWLAGFRKKTHSNSSCSLQKHKTLQLLAQLDQLEPSQCV